MAERQELSDRFTTYIENLEEQVGQLRTTAENQTLLAEYWAQQKELFEKYGTKIPLAMQTAQFMIDQIAAASSSSLEDLPSVGVRRRIVEPKTKYAVPRGKSANQTRHYDIAPQVKPMMNGILSRGKEDVPEDLDSLFNKMYGLDWQSRTIDVPLGPGLAPTTRTYLEDLHSGNSYIRSLIARADNVINRNMRGNTEPEFRFKGRVAAVGLVQLYNKIDAIGWGSYDNFMLRNRIRQPKAS